ncbi:MAG TPA: glycoside hydrolase family 31, partial [Rhodanobacteraceae bacterium]|nr:glycoside hydrolase family 31 [Rhodanobacteraceae bacterium]
SLSTQRGAGAIRFDIGAPEGAYRPALAWYRVTLHVKHVVTLQRQGEPLTAYASAAALDAAGGEGWYRSQDRYGASIVLKLAAARAQAVELRLDPAGS